MSISSKLSRPKNVSFALIMFPNQGFEEVKDEFMLGDSILVAPLDKKGTSRQLVLPKGEWIDDDGKPLTGGAIYTLDVPLDRIPYFRLNK